MSHRRFLPLVAVLAACTAAPPPSTAPAVPTPDDTTVHEARVRAYLAERGWPSGRMWVIAGAAWSGAANSAATLAEAMAQTAPGGIMVEPRGRSFCARSPASTDCMQVSVVGGGEAGVRLDQVVPTQVEAVAWVEAAPPGDAAPRMAWREELRTGRVVILLRR